MSTLYRTHRPQVFSEIKGQAHIVDVLQTSIASQTLPHALLFSGSRGLGKTSIARIVAHESGTAESDIIEIDAASTRGIDDIRALKEEVNVLPRESEKKVYIIDEVHMLTREAFNALLKTLEEPPRHVMFILATTEIHKVPDTIISRCQVHHFVQPDLPLLAEHLQSVAQKEGREITPDIAQFLAERGHGSYRDALGALQKTLDSLSSDALSIEAVRNLFRSIPIERALDLLESIHRKDVQRGFETVTTVGQTGDVISFFSLLITTTRTIILNRSSVISHDHLVEQHPPHIVDRIENLAQQAQSSINSHFLLSLLEHGKLVRTSPEPLIVIETLFLTSVEKN